MEKDNRLIWLNGEILNLNDAKINVLTPTSQFGANVFEGIRCYWSDEEKQLYAFRLQEHYNRLENSIKIFRMNCPYTMDECEAYMKDIVKANGFQEDIAVRQTVFVDGFGSWFAKEPIGMFIAPIAKTRKEVPLVNGERTCVSSWERISDKNFSPRVKVGANYINSRLAKLEAADYGYDSAIFLNYLGYVAEGTGSCFFLIKDGALITPRLTDSVLESITRSTIIEIAKKELELEVVERHINRTELYTCDEAFFCGSAVEVTPIIQFDSYMVGNGMPGENTCMIHEKYLEIATGKNEKYKHWLTPIY